MVSAKLFIIGADVAGEIGMLRESLLMTVLTLLLVGVGYVVGVYFGDPSAFTLGALALAAVFNMVSYFYSDRLVLAMTRAKVVSESEEPRLHRIVGSLAAKHGIPKPKVAVVPSRVPNAFATGRGPSRAVVAATQGLMGLLNDDEVEAVLAHEVGHVVNRDTLIGAMAATIAGAISYVALFGRYAVFAGGGRDDREGGNPIFLLLALLLVPVAAMFIRLAISRSREYKADEAGARATGRPQSLAGALMKIESYARSRPLQGVSPATSSLWIVNPFSGANLVELFSTHPSTRKRVENLKRIGRDMGLYIDFDLQT